MTQPIPEPQGQAALVRLEKYATWCIDYQPFGVGGPAGDDGYKVCKKCERSQRAHDIRALLDAAPRSEAHVPAEHKHRWFMERNQIHCHEPGCTTVGMIIASECYECGQPTEPPTVCPKCAAEMRGVEAHVPTRAAVAQRIADAVMDGDTLESLCSQPSETAVKNLAAMIERLFDATQPQEKPDVE